MFTGIIRHCGTVAGVRRMWAGTRLSVGCMQLASNMKHGASVCVNGVCLTVVEARDAILEFDVIAETVRRSTLGSLRVGKRVNLEPSLCAGDPIDGHIVQGHVDGTAELVRKQVTTHDHLLTFRVDPSLAKYLIPKGSVALDGVSLTIAECSDSGFTVALIPTTLDLTMLAHLAQGDRVNIETDMLARTIVHTLHSLRGDGGISLQTLEMHGFA